MAFTVEVDSSGCPACGSGRSWVVLGPDGVGLGTSYGDQEEARHEARRLTDAYRDGLAAAFTIANRRKCKTRRTTSWTVPADIERRKQRNGRRDDDAPDDIPF